MIELRRLRRFSGGASAPESLGTLCSETPTERLLAPETRRATVGRGESVLLRGVSGAASGKATGARGFLVGESGREGGADESSKRTEGAAERRLAAVVVGTELVVAASDRGGSDAAAA